MSHLVVGIERCGQSDPISTTNLFSTSMLEAAEGWYDAAVLPPSRI
jgi:hypothetical protein